MYAISVIIVRNNGGWTYSRPLPIFYLNEKAQGITSEAHARRIALSLLNPFGISSHTYNITAVKVQ